ncbi:MAG: 2-phospho-L-lactate transferase CofD family protein, partial [Chloroflexota bacterium]|nr:2-phospho-L-lactate transferase CofD family protein [Chloroflexota bacterium]
VFLRDEEAEVYPGVVEALHEADLITFGPGSLFTTVIASLLVRGVREAIAEARERGARTVYICNTTTQPGQTDGLTAYDHVAEVASYLGADLLDYALINTGIPAEATLERFRRNGLLLLAITPEEVRKITDLGVQVVAGSMIEQRDAEYVLWNKQDAIRHDPAAVARELVEVFNQPRAQAMPAGERSVEEAPQAAAVAHAWNRA